MNDISNEARDMLANRLRDCKRIDRDLDARVAVALYSDTNHADSRENTYARLPSKSDECAPGTYWVSAFSGLSLRTAPGFTGDKLLQDLATNAIARSTPQHGDDVVERVARAIAVADGKNPDAPAWARFPGPVLEGICWRDQYADKARAALAVLVSGDIEIMQGLYDAIRKEGPDGETLTVRLWANGDFDVLKHQPGNGGEQETEHDS